MKALSMKYYEHTFFLLWKVLKTDSDAYIQSTFQTFVFGLDEREWNRIPDHDHQIWLGSATQPRGHRPIGNILDFKLKFPMEIFLCNVLFLGYTKDKGIRYKVRSVLSISFKTLKSLPTLLQKAKSYKRRIITLCKTTLLKFFFG